MGFFEEISLQEVQRVTDNPATFLILYKILKVW